MAKIRQITKMPEVSQHRVHVWFSHYEPDGVFVIYRGLSSEIAEIEDPEMLFAPQLVELPIITGDQFAQEKT